MIAYSEAEGAIFDSLPRNGFCIESVVKLGFAIGDEWMDRLNRPRFDAMKLRIKAPFSFYLADEAAVDVSAIVYRRC